MKNWIIGILFVLVLILSQIIQETNAKRAAWEEQEKADSAELQIYKGLTEKAVGTATECVNAFRDHIQRERGGK